MKSFIEFLEEKETPKASEFEIGTKVKSFQYPGSRADSYLIGKVYNSDDNYHYIDVESAMDKGAEKYSFDKKVRASRFPHPHTGEYGVVKESTEELDEALPPHLQKHVDNYNAKQAKFKVTDVTPKGYGPEDEEESEESKRLKLVIARARNGQRANESLDEASFYPANMDKLSPEERKAAHDMLMKRQSETNKKLADMRSMSPEELHASFNKKPVTESSNTHDKRRAFNKGKTDFSLGKNRVPPNAVGYDAEAKKQWLRGWDSANLSNPITESDAHDRVKQVLDKVQAKNNPPTQEEKDAAYAKHIARMKKSAEEYVNNTPNSIYKKKED